MPQLSWKTTRTAVIAVMLAVGLALAGAGAAGARTTPFLQCGTLRGAWGARYSIVSDRAGCTTARSVFTALFARKGSRRMDPFTSQIDKVINNWMCASLAAGYSCLKLGPHGAIPARLGPNISAEVL